MSVDLFKENIPEGTTFESRMELKEAGLHKYPVHGISDDKDSGCAFSVVVAGGYIDDEDLGDEIIYTGEGGRNEKGQHVKDQVLSTGNKALITSENQGTPVRVIRKKDPKNIYAPNENYRYDGLYIVDHHMYIIGREGFRIYRFRLLKIKETSSYQVPIKINKSLPEGNETPQVKEGITYRRIRDTKLSKEIKRLYDYYCQVCGTRIETEGGYYAEAAHIKALGKPHNGPDTPDNIICLCPNHHVMFDKNVFSIAEDFSLVGIKGYLDVKSEHKLNREFLSYHRNLKDSYD